MYLERCPFPEAATVWVRVEYTLPENVLMLTSGRASPYRTPPK